MPVQFELNPGRIVVRGFRERATLGFLGAWHRTSQNSIRFTVDVDILGNVVLGFERHINTL